ncbi:MAG: hypothetical protein M1274_14765 [Actinobacteria bacterium]|nr:hypothetical protein [Actinomycetota bacterium]
MAPLLIGSLRNRFTSDEIRQLKVYTHKKLSAPPHEHKRWRDKMRELGFYMIWGPSRASSAYRKYAGQP